MSSLLSASEKRARRVVEFQSAAKVFWSLQLGNPFQAETTTGFVNGGRTSKEGGNGESLVAVGDLDHDGATDLVLSSVTRKTLSILYQDPTQKRTFGLPIDIALRPTLSSAPLALGDIDGDGYTDVIVGNKNNGVSVLCGNKTRTHSLIDATLALTGNSVTQLALADMDNDAAGKPDVVLTLETGEMWVLLNPGEPQKKKTCADATAWIATPQNQVRLKLASTDKELRYLSQLSGRGYQMVTRCQRLWSATLPARSPSFRTQMAAPLTSACCCKTTATEYPASSPSTKTKTASSTSTQRAPPPGLTFFPQYFAVKPTTNDQ